MWWSRIERKAVKPSEASRGPDARACEQEPTREAEAADRDFDAALDTVAAILRTLGRFTIQVDGMDAAETLQQFEDWARHVLVLAPHPGLQGGGQEHRPVRDWGGLRSWILKHRKAEVGGAQAAISDLRQALWTFVRSFARAFSEDGESDGQMQTHLQRLRSVVELNSTHEIRREALLVAESINAVVQERKSRQRLQITDLAAQLTSLGSQLEEAKREGAIDPLTRLFNRKAFDEQLARTVDMAWLLDRKACLLLVDIDHFKRINDTWGHPCGDQVLRELGDCFTRAFLRKSDFVARYGGEEFGVILDETAIADGAMLAGRLRIAISKMVVDWQGTPIRLTASVGVADTKPGESAATWLARVDGALYAAKRAGRNRVMTDADAPSDLPVPPAPHPRPATSPSTERAARCSNSAPAARSAARS